VCKTGQYSTYKGDFYTNKKNKHKFKLIGEAFKKNPKYRTWRTSQEKYTAYLKQNFSQKTTTAKNIDLMRNNFYGYVNDVWLKETDLESGRKSYYVQHDDFRIKQEEVYYKLISYIEDFIKKNPHDKKAIAIKNVYDSLKNDTLTTFHKHADLIQKEVEAYIEKDDLIELLAGINKLEIISWNSPVSWTLLPDEKNVKVYISHLNVGQLGLYDYLLYFDDPSDKPDTKSYKRMIKREYLHYISEVFKACLGKEEAAKINPIDIWTVETMILTNMICQAKVKTDKDYYNPVSAHELESFYGFEWTRFAKLLGYDEVPQRVIVGNTKAFKCVVRMLKDNWKNDEFKHYWMFIQFRQMIRFENSLRHIHYNFFNKIIEGQPTIMPSEIYPIFGMSMMFNTFLSEQYIENNYNPLYVKYVKMLTDDLKQLFIQKLKRNGWLSPLTKKYALEKLHKLTIQVGVPDQKLREDPLLDYQPDDPLANVGRLLYWKLAKMIALEGKPIIDVPDIDWQNFKLVGTQCYVVNAFYRPTSNSIYVPLAYLQKPFIDLDERGLEYNLVYIGYTLGHELSHALDDSGSKYDADGNLNNWWTPHDRRVFMSKVKDVISQYELFAKRDGLEFDAEPAAGESLADISGYALIEEYLMDNQIINDEDIKLKKVNLAKLYMNLAIQGRQKIYKQALKAQLKTNPHPPEKYRVNCPLTRLQLFRTIFGVKKGDGMWWHNTDTIWWKKYARSKNLVIIFYLSQVGQDFFCVAYIYNQYA